MKNLIMICALVLGSQVAKAGGFVEPYLGYGMNKIEGTYAAAVPVVGGASFDAESKGPVYGIRAGYQFILPWVALDVSQFKGDGQDGANDVKATDIGVTAGVSLPIIRPYAGYVFSSKADSGSAELTGTAMKVGVGFGFIPLLHLNVELVDTKFKEVNDNDIDTVYSDFKSKTTVISLSYVF